MLKQIRQELIETLWLRYRDATLQMQLIEQGLREKNTQLPVLDHFATIDLPSVHTGIPQLCQVFSALGYEERGKGYLKDKQNDFLWMAEVGADQMPAKMVLPQVVVADFRLDELPHEVRQIIEKYASKAAAPPLEPIHYLLNEIHRGNTFAQTPLLTLLTQYFNGRDWPTPTVREFLTVQAFNELLAWVLVFGRKPNHFTLSIHHLLPFADISEFHHFVENELQLQLNQEGGKIKGGQSSGIAQGSTTGILQTVQLNDGEVKLPMGFVEFVWRYPQNTACQQPPLWGDYFTDFVAQYADHVIESLYLGQKNDILCNIQG